MSLTAAARPFDLGRRDDELATTSGVVRLSLVVLLAMICLRNAWMCDDAFLSLRTLENWVSGVGLSWNPGVRVQAYSHPLWLFFLAVPYVVTREPYFTTLALSFLCGIATISVIAFRVARTLESAMLVLVLFSMSEAVVSYTTSGLENPLTHLLLVLGCVVSTTAEPGRRHLCWSAMLVAGLILTAPLAVPLVLPVVLWFWRNSPRAGWWTAVGFGLLPAAAWFVLALWYYGSLLPTPAVAWLNNAVPFGELCQQGVAYLTYSAVRDPWSVALVLVAGVATVWRGDRGGHMMLAGLLLGVFAVVAAGGDALGGRLLSPVVLWAGLLLARTASRVHWPLVLATGVAVAGALVVGAPPRTWAYGDVFPRIQGYAAPAWGGVVDGRTFFHMATGLTNWSRSTSWKTGRWASDARGLLASNPSQVWVTGPAGMVGYLAGPRIYVWDAYGNLDPVVARLPGSPRWSPRATPRAVPDGYRRMIESGVAFEGSAPQQELVSRVKLATAGALTAPGRWRAILDLALSGGPVGEGRRQVRVEDVVAAPISQAAWNAVGATSWTGFSVADVNFAPRGIVVNLPAVATKQLVISLSSNDDYFIDLYFQSHRVRRLRVAGASGTDGALVPHVLDLGHRGLRIDRIAVLGRRGDFRYAIGRVQLQ